MSMIAIAGVIGAGLFVGSGAAINKAGPGILLSYAGAGVLVILVMRMLGEMAAASPESGSFSAYADRALGRWAGMTIGWLYWFFWVVVLAVEATAGARIMHNWISGVPQWAFALAVMLALTATNLFSVASYGEFEFWFAAIKVTAIVVFIVLGGLAVFGVLPDTDPVGLRNLTGQGGFLPNGFGAVASGILLVVFSFMGSEIVTIAAGESAEPARAVTKATNSVIWRVIVFYLGSIAIVVTLLPWHSSAITESPYVAVLDNIGVPGAATVMDVVVLTAVLSCLNSGLYTASRMAFSLSQRGDAPRSWMRVTRRGVPRNSILASVAFGFVAVFFNYTSPETVFTFLLNSSGAVALFVWLVICFSQLRMRRDLQRQGVKLMVRMWGYPYLTWATIALIGGVIVYMLTDHDGRTQVLLSMLIAAGALGISLGLHWWRRRAASEAETACAAIPDDARRETVGG